MAQAKRLCIYPKDIQIITGRSERYAREYLRSMKDALEKEGHQFVTVKEFSEYSDIPLAQIESVINYIK